jgi:hypothetical protein
MKMLFEHFMNDTDWSVPRLMSWMNEFERMYIFYEGLVDALDINKGEDPDYVWIADQDLRVWGEAEPLLPHTVDSPFDDEDLEDTE